MQTTLKSAVRFDGFGLHSGIPVRMTVRPAMAEHGIWFRRTDIGTGDRMIPARWDAVQGARLCTLLANPSGVTVSTVEHIMAALAGCGIHNALIDIDGPEVPILDGSAAPFVSALIARGLRALDAPVRVLRITETVEVRDGTAFARLSPADALEIAFHIDFPDRAIGRQDKTLNMSNGAFVRELCDARTFCRQQDVDTMRLSGLALGGSLDNAVVIDGDHVLTPGGLRYPDEAVRHKMLDALGDLALAGAPILGRYVGHLAGHALTNKLLRAVFARPGAFRMVECGTGAGGKLPGVGVTRADIAAYA